MRKTAFGNSIRLITKVIKPRTKPLEFCRLEVDRFLCMYNSACMTCPLYKIDLPEYDIVTQEISCCFCFLIFQHRTLLNKAVGYYLIYFSPLPDKKVGQNP